MVSKLILDTTITSRGDLNYKYLQTHLSDDDTMVKDYLGIGEQADLIVEQIRLNIGQIDENTESIGINAAAIQVNGLVCGVLGLIAGATVRFVVFVSLFQVRSCQRCPLNGLETELCHSKKNRRKIQ